MSLYDSQTIANYNATPPSDDGAAETQNKATWSGIKTKLGDPVKTLAEAINTELFDLLNTNIATSSLSLIPGAYNSFYATATTTQTGLVTGTWTQIEFDSAATLNIGTNYSTTTDVYTVPAGAGGLYLFGARVATSTSLAGGTTSAIRIQGSTISTFARSANEWYTNTTRQMATTGIGYLVAGETVQADFLHDHGSNVTLQSASVFFGVRLT